MNEAEGIPLPGGRMTSGLVRHGDRVRRPTGPWSPAVHEYLRHLASAGFEGSPRVLAPRLYLTWYDGALYEIGGYGEYAEYGPWANTGPLRDGCRPRLGKSRDRFVR
jgi:hypothetical protein